MEPEASTADLFNSRHDDFVRAARAGVTTVLLAPSSSNLIGGSTFAVKTAGRSRLVGPGPLKLSLSSRAFNVSRVPTSVSGALAELRRMIAGARADRNDGSAFAKWARGETAAFVDVDDAAGLSLLARFAGEESLKCIAVHGNYAAERMDDAKSLGQPIVLGTYEFSDTLRFTRAPGLLEKAGVEVILTCEPPRFAPEMLRIGAAIAMKQGLSRRAAQASMTLAPAKLLGLEKQIGAISPGMDADFVIYSGDPLRLSSAVHEVFVGGDRVYSRDDDKSNDEMGAK
ncbi:MAG: amidohydrolase family protein [Planctomycetes bacterium]|nr:amidohydrolase family protein [Planctomycetota bacterium]